MVRFYPIVLFVILIERFSRFQTIRKKAEMLKNEVIVPFKPNLDKLAMIWMLRRLFELAGKILGLVKEFTVGFLTVGILPDGMTWKDFSTKLFCDCAGSPLDGHGENCEKSGFQLLAEKLGVDNLPRYSRLIWQLTKQDKKGRDQKVFNHIASVVIGAWRLNRPFEEVLDWVCVALDAIADWEEFKVPELINRKRKGECLELHPWFDLSMSSVRKVIKDDVGDSWFEWGQKVTSELQKTLMKDAKTEFEKATPRVIQTFRGEKNLSVFSSENPFLAGYALKKGHIVISQLKTSVSTTMMIAVPQDSGLHLQLVVGQLRLAEAEKRKIKLDTSWELLFGQGKHPQLPNIHVLEDGLFQRILIGSEQHPDVEQLYLTIEEIISIVEFWLAPRIIEKKKPQKVQNYTMEISARGHTLERAFR